MEWGVDVGWGGDCGERREEREVRSKADTGDGCSTPRYREMEALFMRLP